MARSVFCPCVPGDSTFTRRFFEAILQGCLPVVISWDMGNGQESWWQRNIKKATERFYPWSESYPFCSRFDYRRFVVRVKEERLREGHFGETLVAMSQTEVRE